jgi:hypothetical protein
MPSIKRTIKRKQNNMSSNKVSFNYENVWTCPKLLKYIENSTITKITSIYVNSNNLGKYNNNAKNGMLLIGYKVKINIGLYSTEILCIHRFLKKWEKNSDFNKFLNSYINGELNICIISSHSKSWGKAKEAQAMPKFLKWIGMSEKMLVSAGVPVTNHYTLKLS